MDLPVMPPVAPMLAKSVKTVPDEPGFLYEPKWDGFRCIVFRDGDEVELGSRNERPMTRYFPEIVAAVQEQLPERCVVDAEIVIATGDKLDFEALLQRIHPAVSRVTLLAEQTPASLVVFDLLALGDESYLEVPLGERRTKLDQVLAGVVAPVHRTSVTDDPAVARQWFDTFEGAGLDGVVAKPVEGTYEPDKRAMLKIKHERTADCVVAGFRWHKTSTPEQPLLGSLLLGLYNDEGQLQHVGVVASFPMKRRAELVEELAPWRENAVQGHPWQQWAEAESSAAGQRGAQADGRRPGAQSRWNAKKDLSWEPLRAERVVEVRYDHMEGSRFRHTTQFVRWRDDREPPSCTYEQLDVPVSYDLASLLS
jgi:ATP-dependent DNA ligase